MEKIESIIALIFCVSFVAVGQEERLIGNNFDLAGTANEGDFSCILTFTSLGQRDLGEPNCWIYINAKIEIESLLFEKTITSQIVEFSQRTFPDDQSQELPQVGKKYLAVGFFNAGQSLSIRKLTEPIPSNIEIVEEAAIRRGIQPKNYVRAVIGKEGPKAKGGTLFDGRSVGNQRSHSQGGAEEPIVPQKTPWWFFGGGGLLLILAICCVIRTFRRAQV